MKESITDRYIGIGTAVIKRLSQKSNTDKKKLEFYFLCGCVLGVVLGIVGMALYLIANG